MSYFLEWLGIEGLIILNMNSSYYLASYMITLSGAIPEHSTNTVGQGDPLKEAVLLT